MQQYAQLRVFSMSQLNLKETISYDYHNKEFYAITMVVAHIFQHQHHCFFTMENHNYNYCLNQGNFIMHRLKGGK